MPKAHTRCYSIEIKNAEGVRLFSTKAYWTQKERHLALGQIMRLAGMPEASFYAEPALEPQSEKRRHVEAAQNATLVEFA